MSRCPYCGAEVRRGVDQCPGCERKIGANHDKEEARHGLTSRDTYEKKTVPVWLFVAIVALFLSGLALIFFG